MPDTRAEQHTGRPIAKVLAPEASPVLPEPSPLPPATGGTVVPEAVAPQSLYEMYVVCSRPARANGFGMTPQQAHAEITPGNPFDVLGIAQS